MFAEVPGGGALPWACLSGIKRSLCKESVYDGGICRVDLTGNHSGGVCVFDSIHHNIVCPRASFSHTQIVEIALTVAYTVTQTWLYAIYTNKTNTHSFHTKYSSASVSLRHTHGHANAFTCCFCTPPRHTPFRHSPLSSHTNLAFRYSLSSSSSRQADMQQCVVQCCVVVVWWCCFSEKSGPV